MATAKLSDHERGYIIAGIEADFRADGRSRKEFRNFNVHQGVISNTNGSAQLQLGSTSVLVGVKAELGTPDRLAPDQGRVEFFVDCSALATPEFEGRTGEELGSHLGQLLQSAFCAGRCLDLRELCVVPGKICWNVYVDALVVEWGGSVLDAVTLAIWAALQDTKVPKLERVGEGEDTEIEVLDDPSAYEVLTIDRIPLVVTLTLVGEEFLVDATLEEESCCSAQLLFSVDPAGRICATMKGKLRGIPRDCLSEGITLAQVTSKQLFQSLTAQTKNAVGHTTRDS